ncbi:MAG: hypothetical protein WAN92_09495 [Herbaspirillum sp.]
MHKASTCFINIVIYSIEQDIFSKLLILNDFISFTGLTQTMETGMTRGQGLSTGDLSTKLSTGLIES